jgi:fatty-acyl-CoA synthase
MEDWPRTTFADALARSAALWPEAVAIVTPDERITFGALQAEVRKVAANLHRLGLRRGDHMALCMGNSVR